MLATTLNYECGSYITARQMDLVYGQNLYLNTHTHTHNVEKNPLSDSSVDGKTLLR